MQRGVDDRERGACVLQHTCGQPRPRPVPPAMPCESPTAAACRRCCCGHTCARARTQSSPTPDRRRMQVVDQLVRFILGSDPDVPK